MQPEQAEEQDDPQELVQPLQLDPQSPLHPSQPEQLESQVPLQFAPQESLQALRQPDEQPLHQHEREHADAEDVRLFRGREHFMFLLFDGRFPAALCGEDRPIRSALHVFPSVRSLMGGEHAFHIFFDHVRNIGAAPVEVVRGIAKVDHVGDDRAVGKVP